MKKKEEILEAIEFLKALSHFINKARTDICIPYKISPTQATILIDIYHHQNQTKITDICKRLRKTTNTISPLVNKLVQKGYLVKQQNSQDNRIFEVFFSEEGLSMMHSINQDVLNFSTPLFEELSDEEFQILYDTLIRLNKVCGTL